MTIHFREITPDNWRIFNSLKVRQEQSKFVAPNVTIMARAYAFRNQNSHVYAIYYAELPVGLLMQRDYEENGKIYCVLDQFMIGEQYQGRGYGKAALQEWMSFVGKKERYEAITLCYHEEDEVACKLYESAGFQHTGEVDEEEISMVFPLDLL